MADEDQIVEPEETSEAANMASEATPPPEASGTRPELSGTVRNPSGNQPETRRSRFSGKITVVFIATLGIFWGTSKMQNTYM